LLLGRADIADDDGSDESDDGDNDDDLNESEAE
jgi:hypothetical protein